MRGRRAPAGGSGKRIDTGGGGAVSGGAAIPAATGQAAGQARQTTRTSWASRQPLWLDGGSLGAIWGEESADTRRGRPRRRGPRGADVGSARAGPRGAEPDIPGIDNALIPPGTDDAPTDRAAVGPAGRPPEARRRPPPPRLERPGRQAAERAPLRCSRLLPTPSSRADGSGRRVGSDRLGRLDAAGPLDSSAGTPVAAEDLPDRQPTGRPLRPIRDAVARDELPGISKTSLDRRGSLARSLCHWLCGAPRGARVLAGPGAGEGRPRSTSLRPRRPARRASPAPLSAEAEASRQPVSSERSLRGPAVRASGRAQCIAAVTSR